MVALLLLLTVFLIICIPFCQRFYKQKNVEKNVKNVKHVTKVKQTYKAFLTSIDGTKASALSEHPLPQGPAHLVITTRMIASSVTRHAFLVAAGYASQP